MFPHLSGQPGSDVGNVEATKGVGKSRLISVRKGKHCNSDCVIVQAMDLSLSLGSSLNKGLVNEIYRYPKDNSLFILYFKKL